MRAGFLILPSLLLVPLVALGAEGGQEGVFPAFDPPRHLQVLDLGTIDARLHPTLATLQGVVNRHQPRIYLIYSYHGWTWLENTIIPAGVTYNEVLEPWDLVEEYRRELSGFIIYDPELPDTVNVGTTMAGVLDAALVHPSYAYRFEQYGLPLVADLRGRWSAEDVSEMYTWAFDNYWENCSHDILGHLEPEISHLRDYLVACRAFTFFADLEEPKQEEFLVHVLSREDVRINTPILGYLPNERGVRLASEHGCYLVCSSFAASLTVHSSVPVESPLVQERRFANLHLEDKTYVCFVITDGGLACNMDYTLDQWQDEGRGTVPIGWTVAPHLCQLAPALVKWYYENATDQDYFMSGPSGAGLIYPSLHPDPVSYSRLTSEVLETMDLTESSIWNFPGEGDLSIARLMLREMDLRALIENAREHTTTLDGRTYLGTRMIAFCMDPQVDLVEEILGEISSRRSAAGLPGFICVSLAACRITPSVLLQVASSLGDEFEVVGPDHFLRLIAGPDLRIRTLDASGEMLPFCDLVVDGPERWNATSTTDRTGRSSFYVGEGEYQVTALWMGRKVNSTTIYLDHPCDLDLTCQVHDLTVNTRDCLGFSARGAKVEMLTAEGELLASGRTDGRGMRFFGRLPRGEYRLVATIFGLKRTRDLYLAGNREVVLRIGLSHQSLGLILIVVCCLATAFMAARSRPIGQASEVSLYRTVLADGILDGEYRAIMSEIEETEKGNTTSE
jgi:hypothetical protein